MRPRSGRFAPAGPLNKAQHRAAAKPLTTLADLRRYAVARSLFSPTSLRKAVEQLGFVQADPIRAPARAQDLILRHRVRNYRAGDLERKYARLAVEEDFFVNYGYLPRQHQAHLHPRKPDVRRGSVAHRRMAEILAFAAQNTEIHPRTAAAHFAHGRVRNWFGGDSHISTQLLDRMHYLGMLRVARRDKGIRVYAHRPAPEALPGAAQRQARAAALVDLVVKLYAPLPAATLTQLVAMLRNSAPQLGPALDRAAALARRTLARATIDGVVWYWPPQEVPGNYTLEASPAVRLLAPFDPVVWDRRRFEHLWGWGYRFEAYTPAPRRKLGYYALPLLWRDRVIGWGNLSVEGGDLVAGIGYCAGRKPRGRIFHSELQAELARFADFLSLRGHRETN
jgi:uncharacterized protein YcaQ